MSLQGSKPFVSIIIPCRNEEMFIAKCLDSLIAQDYSNDLFEILVVDGMSTDKTRDIIGGYLTSNSFIKLLDNIHRITPAALNTGIKNAKGDIIMIIGAHSECEKAYVSKCIMYSSEYNADVVGGVMITRPSRNTYIGNAIAFGLSCKFGVGNSLFRTGTGKPVWVDTVFGGCYRKEIFNKIGLFDEELIRNQDDEFNFRLVKNKGNILLVPEVKTIYYAVSSLAKLWNNYFQYGYFKPLVAKKIGFIVTWRQLAPVVLTAVLAISAVFAAASGISAAIFLFTFSVYFIANLFFSIILSISKGVKYIYIMPFVFFAIHFSYGFGYLKGIFSFIILKRALDLTLAFTGIVVFLPLYVIIIVIIYCFNGMPVFFLQERVGSGGKNFKLIKFRTMKLSDRPHSDVDLLAKDARVTRIGSFLRSTAMDELPQLINILKGDMSFVGPKPLPRIIEDEDKLLYKCIDEVPGYGIRTSILPGLTGLAQVYAPKTVSRKNKFRYDILYVKKRNIMLDIKLIIISVFITLMGRWESGAKRKI